jgi:predicted metal-dependent phosphoesterase TrpH
MSTLKADLHLHTREGEEFIAYDAWTLIERAARDGYQVLSITNHNTITYSESLRAYADRKGILLIPGVEATIEGRHVLLYEVSVPLTRIRTFSDLRRHRKSIGLVAAAHPFFPASFCLKDKLKKEIDLFDAIEFSHFYNRRINFNRKAVRLANQAGLPLVGTSDCHLPCQLGTTYSLIEAEPSVSSVLEAIREGRLEVITAPLANLRLAAIAVGLFGGRYLEGIKGRLRRLHIPAVIRS